MLVSSIRPRLHGSLPQLNPLRHGQRLLRTVTTRARFRGFNHRGVGVQSIVAEAVGAVFAVCPASTWIRRD